MFIYYICTLTFSSNVLSDRARADHTIAHVMHVVAKWAEVEGGALLPKGEQMCVA